MPYLNFISDQHLMQCIGEVCSKYANALNKASNEVNRNKVDTIKMAFDMNYYNINHIAAQGSEMMRQADKTISNAIGYFHQHILGGIDGVEDMGQGGGCDITNDSNTIFAELKNKYNTMNSSSSEATYQKLQNYAEKHPDSICYLVEIIAKQSQDIHWEGSFNGRYYSHPNVRRISADKFYELVTGIPDAFKQLCNVLPIAISNYLQQSGRECNNAEKSMKDLYNVMSITFNGYNGF